jgi:subtilisin family serine protease
MALIKQTLENGNNFRTQFGLNPSATWARQANNINIPIDDRIRIFLEYSGMNGSIDVKQADVVLIDDFLNNENPYTLADLDYYAGKQDLNGPGMTFGVFSIVAAEEAPSGCSSYTYDIYGSEPYARGPWYQVWCS